MLIKEHDSVVSSRPLPEHGLQTEGRTVFVEFADQRIVGFPANRFRRVA